MTAPRDGRGGAGSHSSAPTNTNPSPAPQELTRRSKNTAAGDAQRYIDRVGWHDGIPEGHFAIVDPHEPERVTSWRVKSGKLTPWPKEARNGPSLRAWRRDVPGDRVERAAFWEAKRVAHRAYLEQVREILRASPEAAAARYAAITFRCAVCNRPLRVPESNAYGVGPECRSWMPADLLAEYARQVSLLRAELAGGAA